MQTYFLFLLYLIFGTLLLHWVLRRNRFPFRLYHTSAVVLFKVLMGILYGYIFLHYYGGDDTWEYFSKSKLQTDILLTHPGSFIKEFLPRYSLQATHSGWEALRYYVYHFEPWFMLKFLAVLNLFSGKNYYIDVLLFDLLTVAGPLLLFKMLANRFPEKSGMYYLLIFFIPSVSFWCSGIRAESLILLCIAAAIYNGKAYAQGPNGKNAAGIGLAFLGFLFFRIQYLIMFLPAFIAFLYSVGKKRTGPVSFSRIYIVLLLIFTTSLFLPPALQLSRPLIHAQQGFFVLKGNTRYNLDSLHAGPVSFMRILPQATANSIFRPYPWEGRGLLQSLSSIESIFLIAGFFFFILSGRTKKMNDALLWLFLFYALPQLIAIGYTVPFPGAIVRYRTIPFLLLFLFFFSADNLLQQKLTQGIFPKNIKKKINVKKGLRNY
jgi:hypothetical protein